MNALERMSYSAVRDANKTVNATSFVLQPDLSNRHKVDEEVKQTLTMPNAIPFLRDARNVDARSYKQLKTIDMAPTVGNSIIRRKSRDLKHKKVKENGWEIYIKPISKLNERRHSSQRIGFEMI